MEPITHLMTGACLSRAGFNRKAAYATLAMTLAAEMPDIDTVWRVGGPVAAFQHHRGITHTFVGLPFEAALMVGAVWAVHRWRVRARAEVRADEAGAGSGAGLGVGPVSDRHIARPLTAAPVRWGLLYGFVMVALLSHILLDWTNNYGVRPFFPFNAQWYAGSVAFIFEPVIFAVLLLGLVAPALFGLIAGEVGARRAVFRGRGWAIFALTATAGLLGWRGVEHDAAMRLASTAAYGPERLGAEVLRVTASPFPGNPYRWHTVAETPEFYQIATVDALRGTVATDAAQDLFYKPAVTPATDAARRSRLGEVYLDWSSWPLVTEIGPVTLNEDREDSATVTAVSLRDLRFMYDTFLIDGRSAPPLAGAAYVDGGGRVVKIELGGRTQR
jgi:inner membrane protein